MEEKKFDLNSLIGFVLLGAIMIWYFYNNQPTAEQIATQKAAQVQDSINRLNPVADQNDVIAQSPDPATVNTTDSLTYIQTQNRLGAFAYSASLPSAKDNETVL